MEEQRFAAIRVLWEHRLPNRSSLPGGELRTMLGLTENEWAAALDYLVQERLVKTHGDFVELTHAGRLEVEAKLGGRPAPQGHFPSVTVTVQGSVYGPIQAGAVNSQQIVSGGGGTQELLDLVGEVLAAVPAADLSREAQRKIEADARTIELQLQSGEPDLTVVQRCGGSLQRMLEGAVAGAAGTALAAQAPAWIAKLAYLVQHLG